MQKDSKLLTDIRKSIMYPMLWKPCWFWQMLMPILQRSWFATDNSTYELYNPQLKFLASILTNAVGLSPWVMNDKKLKYKLKYTRRLIIHKIEKIRLPLMILPLDDTFWLPLSYILHPSRATQLHTPIRHISTRLNKGNIFEETT